jgi:hypothetical protein
MKKMIFLAIGTLLFLPSCCCWRKKPVQTIVVKKEDLECERISGPLNDKNICWTAADKR